MPKQTKVSEFHTSFEKKIFDYFSSLSGLLILSPLIFAIVAMLKIFNRGPILFRQKRVGKNGKVFTLIKFRTMIVGAEKLQSKYKHLNISDGPTFKIPNDPRYTRFGKYLVKSGLDELPQLINVLKGEMSIVGPRPLPIYEAVKLTKSQKVRELINPGITSDWVINGAHNLKFKDWMELDKQYMEKANLTTDIQILLNTAFLIFRIGLHKISKVMNYHG